MRSELVRAEVLRLVRQQPFLPFLLNMENGDRVLIEHPENIAFVPDSVSSGNGSGKGLPDFVVLSHRLRYYGVFEAVTAVSMADTNVIAEP